MPKVNKGEFNVHLFFPEQKAKNRRALLVHSQTFRSQPFVLSGWWWMCTVLCVCLLVSVVVCAEAFSNKCSNTYACCITTPIRPSLSPSLPNSNSFISLSLFNKAPIHCPANQSLHSCSQLSMTRFIWLGPCPFSILLVWTGHWKPDYRSMSHT